MKTSLNLIRKSIIEKCGSLPNVSDTPNTAGEQEEGGASGNVDWSSPNLVEMLNTEDVRPGQQQEGKYKCIYNLLHIHNIIQEKKGVAFH
jgi:hypothetical protein